MQRSQNRSSTSGAARGPRTKLKAQKPVLKPQLDPEIQKCKNDPGLSHRQILWNTGAKFFKKVLKNFKRGQSGPQEAITVRYQKDRRRNPEFRISNHCPTLGQNFSIFKKLEKFTRLYILGQIFPFLSKKNWKNTENHPDGPREGVSPDIDEMGLVKE